MNKVKYKFVILLLVAIAMINSVFAKKVEPTITKDSVWIHVENWKKAEPEKGKENLKCFKIKEYLPPSQSSLDSFNFESVFFKEGYYKIEGIYYDGKKQEGIDLDSTSSERMDIPKNNEQLKNAIVAIFKIYKGELNIIEESTAEEEVDSGGIGNGKEQEGFLHKFLLYVLFAILLLGLLYLFFMLIRLKSKYKQSLEDYLQEKAECSNNNLQEISNLKLRIEQLETTVKKEFESISEIKKKLTQLQISIKEVKESNEAYAGDMPSKTDEVKKAGMIQYYFATPQTDTFAMKVPQADYDAFWVIEVSDENAQTGIYKVNENKKNQLLSNAEVYLKPFLDIQNMNAVSKPTRIEYLSNGKVTRTTEGYWKITERAKINLL